MPILSSKLDAYSDILEDGKDVIYHNGKPENIASELLRIFKNEKLQNKLSKNIIKTVQNCGDIEKWSKVFLDRLEDLLKKEKPFIYHFIKNLWVLSYFFLYLYLERIFLKN